MSMELQIPLLWVTVLAPPLLAILFKLLTLEHRNTRLLSYLTAFILLIPVFISVYYLGFKRVSFVKDPIVLNLTDYGIGYFMLVIDGVSLPIVLGISIVTALVSVYSIKYMEHRIDELRRERVEAPGIYAYYILYNAFSSSMLGMAYSTNLIEFFIFLEISLITSFALIAYYGYGDRLRIALMYFVWTHIGGALFLVGILFYGVNTGGFDIIGMDLSYNRVYAGLDLRGLAILAPISILLGLMIKMAIIGVHMWLPYAHAEAPTPVSALLSPNLIGIAGYAIARFSIILFPEFMVSIKSILVILSFATIIYGGFVALRQNDFKRFLAYSSISQMGYILLGVSTLTYFGVAGAMIHYLSHAIGKAVLFMISGVFITEVRGLRDMNLMGGLARVYPAMASLALIGFMHLSGIPPTVGLWGELLILIGLVQAYNPASKIDLITIAIAVISAFIITAVYSFIAMRRIFFGRVRVTGVFENIDQFKVTILILGVSGVVFFLVIGLIILPLRDAVGYLLEPIIR